MRSFWAIYFVIEEYYDSKPIGPVAMELKAAGVDEALQVAQSHAGSDSRRLAPYLPDGGVAYFCCVADSPPHGTELIDVY